MQDITLYSVLSVLFLVAVGIYLWPRKRHLPPPLPKPDRVVVNNTTGKEFVVARPSTDANGNPVNPVVRRGAFTVVWPRQTFHNHFRPK